MRLGRGLGMGLGRDMETGNRIEPGAEHGARHVDANGAGLE